jgi:hypothetical protein
VTADDGWARAWEGVGDEVADLLVRSARQPLRQRAVEAVQAFRAKRPVLPARPRWADPAVDQVADMNRAILDRWLADAILRSTK